MGSMGPMRRAGHDSLISPMTPMTPIRPINRAQEGRLFSCDPASFNPEPTAKAERGHASVTAGSVGKRIGTQATHTFAVGSGLNDSNRVHDVGGVTEPQDCNRDASDAECHAEFDRTRTFPLRRGMKS